jgi:hypothetical protein
MGTVSNPACLRVERSEEAVVRTRLYGSWQTTVSPDELRRGRPLAEAVADVHG